MTDIRVPTLGESVTEATVGKWFKQPGDAVAVDEPLVELETDKVTLEVPAPAAGVLSEIAAKNGDTVGVGAVLGQIKDGAAAAAKPAAAPPPAAKAPEPPKPAAAPPMAPAAPTAMPNPPSVRKLGAEIGRRSGNRCRLRRARSGDQGRHACRHRTRGCRANAGLGAGADAGTVTT